MPRFFDPARYNEDWYIELRGEYQKFFDYIIEMCDNAGVWKPNKIDFETRTGFKVNLDLLLKRVNGDKERIVVLENGRWFIPGFIKFQWFNRKSSFNLSTANPRHLNIIRSLDENKIPPQKVRGLAEVWQRSKDEGKDKDSLLTNSNSTTVVNSNGKFPKIEDVKYAFLSAGGTNEMAEAFYSKHTATNWMLNGTPIVKWQSLVGSYVRTWQENRNKGNVKPKTYQGDNKW